MLDIYVLRNNDDLWFLDFGIGRYYENKVTKPLSEARRDRVIAYGGTPNRKVGQRRRILRMGIQFYRRGTILNIGIDLSHNLK